MLFTSNFKPNIMYLTQSDAQFHADISVPCPKEVVPMATSLLDVRIRAVLFNKVGKCSIVYVFENKIFAKLPNMNGVNSYYQITVHE